MRAGQPRPITGGGRGLAGLFAGLPGCSEGDPTGACSLGTLDPDARAADMVNRLNRMNRESLTTSRWRITLVEPCALKLRAEGPDASAEILTPALQHSDVHVEGNVGGSSHGVLVAYAGAPELALERPYEGPRWTDAVEYASPLHALRLGCAGDG